MSAPATRLSLRQLAEEAYAGYERERIESLKHKSERLLRDRLDTLFCCSDIPYQVAFDDDGTAYAVIDGIRLQAPDSSTVVGLMATTDGDRLVQIGGLVDLGKFLAETEADR